MFVVCLPFSFTSYWRSACCCCCCCSAYFYFRQALRKHKSFAFSCNFFRPLSHVLQVCVCVCESECVWLCVCVLVYALLYTFHSLASLRSYQENEKVTFVRLLLIGSPLGQAPWTGAPLRAHLVCPLPNNPNTHTHTLTTGSEHSRNTFCFSRSTTHPFYCPLSIVVFPPALLLKLLQLRLQLQC